VRDDRADLLPPRWPAPFGTGAEDRRALVVLACLRGITPRRLRELAWRRDTAGSCVDAIRRGEAGSDGDREWIDRVDPEDVMAGCDAAGARFVSCHDREYPAELFDLQRDPPGWLFVRGRPIGAGVERVSIVGARRCSALGRDVAHDLGRRVAGAGVTVVSGAAAGIDAASHRGALHAGGRTIAVLGSGIDVAFPSRNAELIEQIAATGTVVSEYAPGTPPEPQRFPARNRILAALGRALVVVEGAARSGSRISVDHALDLGRDVFAVPGPVSSPLAETPLELIREGATMIRGADDLLADLGISAAVALSPPPDLEETERRIYGALARTSLPDAIARVAGVSIPAAVASLIHLELRGLVRSAGGRYELTYATVARPSDFEDGHE
jgi:DNA processing protein